MRRALSLALVLLSVSAFAEPEAGLPLEVTLEPGLPQPDVAEVKEAKLELKNGTTVYVAEGCWLDQGNCLGTARKLVELEKRPTFTTTILVAVGAAVLFGAAGTYVGIQLGRK